jgi:3D (Asp-Asp-Asp) domain-containing protein
MKMSVREGVLWFAIIWLLIGCVIGFGRKPQVVVEEKKVYVGGESDVTYVVTATVYHAVEGQCDSDCLVTASGAKISSAESAYDHRYLAVSRDLLDVFPYGTKVEVSGCGELDGEWVVADTMNKRYKGYIDLLINPDMRGGKWEGVRIRKVNSACSQSE